MLALMLMSAVATAGPHTLMVGVEGSPLVHRRGLEMGGAHSVKCYGVARTCVAHYPDGPTQSAAAQDLSGHPGVRWVERDQRMPVVQHALTDDHAGTSDCPDLWDLPAIGLEAAFDRGLRGAGAPVVAIQDSGFYESHQDFGVVSGRYDYGDGDTTPEVEWSAGVPQHGTFIAGIINGVPDNGLGRAGVLPNGRVNLQKIMDSSGALYFSYAVSAMADIAEGDLGVRVLNYSLGGGTYTTAFEDAVSALVEADILLVAAAANCGVADCFDADNDAYPVYPASFSDDHILAVAGSTRDGSLNPYSHYGAWSVDLAAPGVDICSLGVGSDTDTTTAGGTSYATPLVAASAALVWEASPDLTAVEVARVLRASAAPHPDLDGKVRSGGNLDLEAALDTAVPRLEPLPDTLRMDGTTTVGIDLANVASEGEGTVVLTHSAELTVTLADGAPAGWTASPFGPGDALSLPDAGTHVASGSGTVLAGPLPARTTSTLFTLWTASADGESSVTVRLVASSAGTDYLNAPYATGTDDETGFLAYTSSIAYTAAELPVDDTGRPVDTGPGGDDGGPEDSASPATDSGADDAPEGSAGSSGSDKGGCAVVAGGTGGWLLGALLVGVRRRSTRGCSDAP